MSKETVFHRRVEYKSTPDPDRPKVRLDWTVTADITQLQGNKEPHFSLCYTVSDNYSRRQQDISGFGPLHMSPEVQALFPHLNKHNRWHLFGVQQGPMHYIANALYWHSGVAKWGDKPNPDHLKSTIVYGALPGDTEVDPMHLSPDELVEWLNKRLPALFEAFDADMRELFGEQYQLTHKGE